jgi:hypothetical protein
MFVGHDVCLQLFHGQAGDIANFERIQSIEGEDKLLAWLRDEGTSHELESLTAFLTR